MTGDEMYVKALVQELIRANWLFLRSEERFAATGLLFSFSDLAYVTDTLCGRIAEKTLLANDWDWGFDAR